MKKIIIIAIVIILAIIVLSNNTMAARNRRRTSEIARIEQYIMDWREYNEEWPPGLSTILRPICDDQDCVDLPFNSKYWIHLSFDNQSVGVVASDWEKKCPPDYILVPGNSFYTESFCVMAKTVDQQLSQLEARDFCQENEGQLINNKQWMTIARQAEALAENWDGGIIGLGALKKEYALVNGEKILIDGWEWLDDVVEEQYQPTANTMDTDPVWDWSSFYDEQEIASRYRYLTSFPVRGDWSYDDFRPALSWRSSQGIGRIFHYGDSSSSRDEYAVLRGGEGLFSTLMNFWPTDRSEMFKFRCVKVDR